MLRCLIAYFFLIFFRLYTKGIRKFFFAIEIRLFFGMFQSHNRIVLLQPKSNFISINQFKN